MSYDKIKAWCDLREKLRGDIHDARAALPAAVSAIQEQADELRKKGWRGERRLAALWVTLEGAGQ